MRRMKKMLSKKETEYLDRSFDAFLREVQERFHLTPKEVLREIDIRLSILLSKYGYGGE